MPSRVSTGEGHDPAEESGASGASPPAYGERNVGKALQATWEILPAKRLAAIRLKPKRGKGGRKSEGVTVPLKGGQQNHLEGRTPASTKQPEKGGAGACPKRPTTDMNEPVKPAGFSFGFILLFSTSRPCEKP